MDVTFLGPGLFERDTQGQLKSRIGTLFPRHQLIVTAPGIHAAQRLAFIDHLNQERQRQGQPPLSADEEWQEMIASVDLFFDPGKVLIRPDPDNMALAFEGDELLQELVSKQKIKFLFAFNPKVQQCLKARGECWRITALPRSVEEIRRLILDARTALLHGPIYYYNRATGTRFLTFEEFQRLGLLPAPQLAAYLQEIADHSRARNRLGNAEVGFFQAAPAVLSAASFAGVSFEQLPEAELRERYQGLLGRFGEAVPPDFRSDDLGYEAWRNRMYTSLVGQRDDTLVDEILRGLSPEFFLQISWLPGVRFEEGEVVFDSIFTEADEHPEDEQLRRLCDPRARGFVFNFIREYGDLEYVNIGHIEKSLSKKRPMSDGHRDVYIAELKPRGAPSPVVRFIRLLKWGIKERLDDGKELLQSILETEEYVDWLLDRRLGCRQLGMNLPPRITIRRFNEVYDGPRRDLRGQYIRTLYTERDYIPGVASDKIPAWKFAKGDYALRLAQMLGRAAATNLIVGRTYDEGATVIFDDGDEVVVEDADGWPVELVVGDHSGAFGEYERPLESFAKGYAKPVNERVTIVPEPRLFAEAYLEAFRSWFAHVQGDYRKRRRAFHTLFKHCRYDPNGSFAFRWDKVLQRLDQSDVETLTEAIRRSITVLPAKG